MKHANRMRRTPGTHEKSKEIEKSEFQINSWSAVEEYFRYKPSSIRKLSAREGCIDRLRNLMSKYDIKFEINVLSGGDTSLDPQHSLAAIVNVQLLSEEQFYSKLGTESHNVIVLIDHITDPRNLGAIIRSCAFFGITDVIIPSRRQVQITTASVNTAQGGFALTNVSVVTNLTRFIKEIRNKGYWVVGTDMSGAPLKTIAGQFEKMALVIGSEDKGLSELVKKNCDVVATIQPFGKTLESLNVSVALGICLYELRSRAL